MRILKTLLLPAAALLCSVSTYAQQINKKLAKELAAIYDDDQRYRKAAVAEAKLHGTETAMDNDLMRKQSVLDVQNLEKIDKIVARYGYPGKSLVGEQQSHVVFSVIQHNEPDVQEKYLPLLRAAAEQGELQSSLLPLMIDRVLTSHQKKQIFGTQLHEVKGGKAQIFPIEDEANVDIRRKKVGLTALHDYLNKWGLDYHLPTEAGNTNPPELYYHPEDRKPLPIEAVGGDKAIYSRLTYPDKAKENNVTGYVTVEFTVDKDGHTKNITVVKGLGYGCDEEAIRVIKETVYTNTSREDNDLRMRLPFPYKPQK